jgi:SAM-dependent methyltransferase
MDSVRYFEFDFAQRSIGDAHINHYLDVSSPRLFPLIFMRHNPNLTATLLNPDSTDLDETRHMIRALGLSERCMADPRLIGACDFADCFDLITSISVIEHIPNDTDALAVMWRALRPGGKLVVTVPCSSTPYEEFADSNQYGLLSPDDDGLIFWERFYSQDCLEQRIFSITGAPSSMEIFGEAERGTYDKNVQEKRRDPSYPIWREPWFVAQKWRFFPNLRALPGMGVVGMSFTKGI